MTRTWDRVFGAMAVGRVVWGFAAYLAPRANAEVVGAGDRATPEVVYLTRIFGGRAIVLGVGYLLSEPEARVRWQRLGLMVDVACSLRVSCSTSGASRRSSDVVVVSFRV